MASLLDTDLWWSVKHLAQTKAVSNIADVIINEIKPITSCGVLTCDDTLASADSVIRVIRLTNTALDCSVIGTPDTGEEEACCARDEWHHEVAQELVRCCWHASGERRCPTNTEQSCIGIIRTINDAKHN